VLFESAAIACGTDVLAVLLTGMGDDGADGMGSIRRAGGLTIAQDEASCVVFGMPARAIERGHVDDVLPLDRIPAAIVDWALGRRRPARDAS
jgi:two-component system chemotaxis response regulator CheB